MNRYLIGIVILIITSCAPKTFSKEWTTTIAPSNFTVQFETSKGNFDIHIIRNLSPKAVDRFYQLVRHRYFDNQLFYRVNPDFVVQFGSTDSIQYNHWNSVKVPDEKVVQGNFKGTISFARGGPMTRTTDLYINLSDNHRLDTINYNNVKGFPSFGKVINGMEVVENLYSGYADTTMDTLNLMYADKKAFLKLFPKLDTIHKVYVKP